MEFKLVCFASAYQKRGRRCGAIKDRGQKSNIGPNQVSDKLESWSLLEHQKELIKYANTLKVTKRSLLKLSTKVFDCLGLLSPFTIVMKCEFQSLCLEKLVWDVELQGNHQRLWKNFVSSLMKLKNVRVPRGERNQIFQCHAPKTPKNIKEPQHAGHSNSFSQRTCRNAAI